MLAIGVSMLQDVTLGNVKLWLDECDSIMKIVPMYVFNIDTVTQISYLIHHHRECSCTTKPNQFSTYQVLRNHMRMGWIKLP